jgi:uncharacterized protein (TIGR03435 family)
MKIALAGAVCFLSGCVPLAMGQKDVAAGAGLAPGAAGVRATFDVSTVKASQTSSRSSSMRSRADGITASGSLRRFAEVAYGLRDFQVTGGPDWVNTSTWEVAAKIDPPDVAPAKTDAAAYDAWNERRMERMQSLLAERFGLKCHMTTKELPVYELVLAKGGSKLKETTAEEGKRGSTNVEGQGRKSQATFTGVTTKSLATSLSSEAGRLVLDKTGLTGSYDFTLTWTNDDHSMETEADAASGPTLFTAVQEQLGLKLEPSKGPVPVLVIDSAERPGEN